MSQAEDLLNSLSENDISTKTEPHIVVGSNRVITVPSELKRIAVQYDHNIETVTFDCPRYWDDHDMSTMNVYINYTRADNEPGCYIADDVAVDETDTSIMHFSWTISRHVTEAVGPLTILICIKMVDKDGNEVNHWNSERNSEMTVSKGMECGDIIAEKYPDIISQIFTTVEEQLRADMGNIADLTTEDKSSLVAAINEAAASGSKDAVTYTPQTLTEAQQAQARDNIGAYTKPASGIPKSDLADDVQTSLNLAGTALQAVPDTYRTAAEQDKLDEKKYTKPASGIPKSDLEQSVQTSLNRADRAYTKPASGIPKSDLEQSVQTSLAKADTAISLGLTAATPGQIIKVKTVQDGKPTEWEAVDGATWSDIKEKPFGEIGEGLKADGGKLVVDTTDKIEQGNIKPVTSAAVYTEIGNINAILESI